MANEQTYKRYHNEILAGIRAADDAFINQLEDNYAFSFDAEDKIKTCRFDKPSLFICGRQDTCVGYLDLWKLIGDYPCATFSVVDADGHNLQIEQPSLFNEPVQSWLLRVEKYI